MSTNKSVDKKTKRNEGADENKTSGLSSKKFKAAVSENDDGARSGRSDNSSDKTSRGNPIPPVSSEKKIKKRNRVEESSQNEKSEEKNSDDSDRNDDNHSGLEDGEEDETGENSDDSDGEEKNTSHVKHKKKLFTVLQTQNAVDLNSIEHSVIKKFKKYVLSVKKTKEACERHKLIDSELIETIDIVLTQKFPVEAKYLAWEEWSDEVCFERLLQAVPDESAGSVPGGGVSSKDKILAVKIEYSPWHPSRVLNFQQTVTQLLKLWRDDVDLTLEKESALLKQFFEEFKKRDSGNKAKKRCVEQILEAGKPETFKDLFKRMYAAVVK